MCKLSSCVFCIYSVKCEQKTVKQAYNIMCSPCASAAEVCAKCGKAEAVAEE